MKRFKLVLLLALGGLVSACANPNVASRNTPFEVTPLPPVMQSATEAQVTPMLVPLTDVRVENITIRVPRSLKVSEANRFLPSGDIVWRDDPVGDRYAQVQAIFETALARGTAPMEGAVPVALDIEVTRFHALTEKARYTTGGVHNIGFHLILRDPTTGMMLAEPRHIRADLNGLGGRAALQAEARGQTQKVRITDHLAHVIRQELTTAEGFENPKLGFIQAMNQM
mmetsp:Transcript_23430/g.41143  ORF Transcript_23430/g.41143 Transcript_23430/m.41143 type:complete len:226 (+) Transcript_23430:2449-3126(+)